MYADFVFVVRGALCIIMASLFISYPSTYLGKCSLLLILYNRLRKRLHSIPEYISRKVKASANIYIIEYAEAFIFQIHPLVFYLRFLFVAGACMPISCLKLKMRYVLLWLAIPKYISRKMKLSSNFYI